MIGIDWDRFAIEEARKDATSKENYVAGNVDEELERFHSVLENRRSLTVIVDPPATGLTSVARQTIIDLAPTILIYVSCNPATLARDLKDLTQRFKLESVTPLDMFPQTAEIEVLAQLQT